MSYLLLSGPFFFLSLTPISSTHFLSLTLGCIVLGLIVLKCINHWANQREGIFSAIVHWIHSLVFEIFAIASMWCFRPMGYLWSLQTKERGGQPILLVHGYMHDSSAWIYLKRRLRLSGFGPIYLLNLKHPFLSLGEYAKKIETRAEQIERETGRKDLILIGHSMGGIVCSFYATKLAPKAKVTDVITIGSPLGGTYMAKIAIGPNGRQMERKSPFLKELRESILSSEGICFYHIGTKTDQAVIPFTSALILEGRCKSLVIKDIGHVSLLYSRRVADQIAVWLKNRNK